MSIGSYPLKPLSSAPGGSLTQVRVAASSRFLNGCMFLMGLCMPLIDFSSARHMEHGLLQRITIVDLVTAVTVGYLLLSKPIKLYVPALVYMALAIISYITGVIFTSERLSVVNESTVSFVAIVMAFNYLLVGFTVGSDNQLVRTLMYGVAAGAMFENVIALHDYFLPPWFPDTAEHRVRGTFRASGQLGSYGYSTAGLLFCMGWTYARSWRGKWLMLLAGLGAAFCVVAASRRSGMFSLGIWLAVFLVFGWRTHRARVYVIALGATVAAVLMVLLNQERLADSYLGERTLGAVESMETGEDFIFEETMATIAMADQWFPFGSGLGSGFFVARNGLRKELHNGHLVVAVEMGLIALGSFYWLAVVALRRRWLGLRAESRPTVKLLVFGFILSCMAFMGHNRLNKDRGYMLFLGLCSCAWVARDPENARQTRGAPQR